MHTCLIFESHSFYFWLVFIGPVPLLHALFTGSSSSRILSVIHSFFHHLLLFGWSCLPMSWELLLMCSTLNFQFHLSYISFILSSIHLFETWIIPYSLVLKFRCCIYSLFFRCFFFISLIYYYYSEFAYILKGVLALGYVLQLHFWIFNWLLYSHSSCVCRLYAHKHLKCSLNQVLVAI